MHPYCQPRGLQISEAQLAIERANRISGCNLNLNYDRNGNNQLNFFGCRFCSGSPFSIAIKETFVPLQLEKLQKSGLMEKMSGRNKAIP